jgi:hypothetical protein
MGFARRAVRRSARRAVRRTATKPVRKAVRTATLRPVRQAMHPAYTARNAVTPCPIKQVTYVAHTGRHPFFAAWDSIIGAVFYLPRIRRRKREVLSAAVSRTHSAPPASAPVRQPAPPARNTPRQTTLPAAEMIRWRNGPGGLAFRAFRTDLADLTVLWDRVTADRGNTQLWGKLISVCTRFGADVSAAMAAPTMPDPAAQRAWSQVLKICQRASEDYRIGVETRDRAMIGRGNAHIQIARAAMQELTARIKVITPPITAPRPASAATQPQPRRVEAWPANRAFRIPPRDMTPPQPPVGPPPSSAGEWELDARRWTGFGDGSRNQ